MRIVALAGGVGAARFLRGLVRACDPEQLTIVVNTGDDREFYGVHVSPDVDIVTYTLAGRVDPERGYGLAGDTFAVIEALGALGHETWFRLGDRDLAIGLHRLHELARHQEREIELAQYAVLALGANELQHVWVSDVEGRHLRAAPAAGRRYRETHLVVDVHER